MFSNINGGGVTASLGFSASAASGDIKGNGKIRNDTALLLSDTPCSAAALFTKNLVKAAPVIYDEEILSKNSDNIRAVLVNSGNANACTGKAGYDACLSLASEAASLLKAAPSSVLTASTGVIGEPFPAAKISRVLPTLIDSLSDENGAAFANAIMTTDTKQKETAVLVEGSSGHYVIGGCCKGAGMIAPSIATMLAFITTDADIPVALLHRALGEAADVSFNSVTIDGDMSTNDSLFMLAGGLSGVKIDEKNYNDFRDALIHVCTVLAKKIAEDGEGATKLVTVRVKGARSTDDARLCASKIANSPLVKTMFAGCDPNWGRLMSSAGASGALFDPTLTDIFFNALHYVKGGVIIDRVLEKDVRNIMTDHEYEITIDLHAGSCEALFYTCDFTADYVKINADYRS